MFLYTAPRQRAAQYKAALAHAFAGIKTHNRFSCSGVVEADLNLQVTGLDAPLRFPLEGEQAVALQGICSTPHSQLCYNGELCDAGLQLQPEQFGVLDETEWQVNLLCMLTDIVSGLNIKHEVNAQLSKLLYLPPGGSVKLPWDHMARQDPGSVARLIVLLPSRHAGGQLVVRYAGAALTYGRSKLPPDLMNYVALDSACDLEITKVTAGHRVCLMYNLHSCKQNNPCITSTATTVASTSARSSTELPQATIVRCCTNIRCMPGTVPMAQNAVEQAAARNSYVVHPGQPLAEMLPADITSPGRRLKRIAVRGRVDPTPLSSSSNPAVVLAAPPPHDMATGENVPPSAWPDLNVTTSTAAVNKQQTASVTSTLSDEKRADIEAITAALAGSMKDWVLHGDLQRPRHLFYLLDNGHPANECPRLDVALLRGDAAMRVQTAAVAAREAGVKLALVRLEIRQLGQRERHGTYTAEAVCQTAFEGGKGGHALTGHALTGANDQEPCRVPSGPMLCTHLSTNAWADNEASSTHTVSCSSAALMVSDWVSLDITSAEKYREMTVDEEHILNAHEYACFAQQSPTTWGWTALALCPKPIAEQPGWGSDEAEATKATNAAAVGDKRAIAFVLGSKTPGSATKRPKSQYELGARPDRTPEYYGRPFGFGP